MTDFVNVEDFPSWALGYTMYADTDGLTKEDVAMVDRFFFEHGFSSVVDTVDGTNNEFDMFPAFGKACETCTVVVAKRKE